MCDFLFLTDNLACAAHCTCVMHHLHGCWSCTSMTWFCLCDLPLFGAVDIFPSVHGHLRLPPLLLHSPATPPCSCSYSFNQLISLDHSTARCFVHLLCPHSFPAANIPLFAPTANSCQCFPSAPARSYGYGYSRDHGAQFQGLGVGMPLSRAYARFLGGHVTWTGDRRAGTTRVRLVLPLDGFHF